MAAVASSSKQQMEVNPRGIPRAPFVANVDEYVGGPSGDVEDVVKKFQETSSKYRYMEINLQQRRKALSTKIPDIEQTLSVVKFLQVRRKKALGELIEEEPASDDEDDLDDIDDDDGDDKKEEGPLKALFELNDTLYAEAEVQETGEVGLWLGANVMLTYPLQEAIDLLSAKLAGAKKTMQETVEDLEWIREQVTVMEVNFARVHNWDVKRRRAQKAAKAESSKFLESSKKNGDGADDDE